MSQYQCNECGKIFARRYNLKKHLTKRKYPCQISSGVVHDNSPIRNTIGHSKDIKLEGNFLSPEKSLELRTLIRKLESKYNHPVDNHPGGSVIRVLTQCLFCVLSFFPLQGYTTHHLVPWYLVNFMEYRHRTPLVVPCTFPDHDHTLIGSTQYRIENISTPEYCWVYYYKQLLPFATLCKFNYT